MVTAFADVIGHPEVRSLLDAELEQPSHAYLFVGPASVGKSTLARRFAAGLLCSDSDERCRGRVVARNHPDLVLVEPEGRTAITVDQTRRIVSQSTLTPLEARRRVFLLEEAGLMNEEAANAILKTLEEPTPASIFLLVTESEGDLPETVVSRCRTVVFGRVPEADVEQGLIARGVEREQAAKAAAISGGRPGLALALAIETEVADFRRLWLGIPMRLPQHPGEAFLLADEALAAGDPLLQGLEEQLQDQLEEAAAEGAVTRTRRERVERELKRARDALNVTGLEILASFYRDAAAAQYGSPVRNPDVPVTALTRVDAATAVANADRVLETIDALRANQRPQLALAALFNALAADD